MYQVSVMALFDAFSTTHTSLFVTIVWAVHRCRARERTNMERSLLIEPDFSVCKNNAISEIRFMIFEKVI